MITVSGGLGSVPPVVPEYLDRFPSPDLEVASI